MFEFKHAYESQTNLRTELSNHQQITQVKIKDYIDKRVDEICEELRSNGPLKPGRLTPRFHPTFDIQKRLRELKSIRENSKWANYSSVFDDRSQRTLHAFHNPWTETGKNSSQRKTKMEENHKRVRNTKFLGDLV